MILNRSALKQVITDRIKNKSGKSFQQLFWDISGKIYEDLITPDMNHDLGSDAHSLENKKFFACYGVEYQYKPALTSKKIRADYEKFKRNWSNLGFNEWIFVTRDNLKGLPLQTIVELNTLKDGIKKSHIGLEQLVSMALDLKKTDQYTIFNIPDRKLFSKKDSIMTIPRHMGGKDFISLDNIATLRPVSMKWNHSEITLGLDIVPYEIEKPAPGESFEKAGFPVVFGEEVNNGNVSVLDVSMTKGEPRQEFYFNSDKNTNKVVVLGRTFIVKLGIIRNLSIRDMENPLEFQFLISEE